MVRTVFTSIGIFLSVFLLPTYAHAQEIPPRSYLFLEVANANGEAVSDATVRLTNAGGKEEVNAKTDANGRIQTVFYRNGGFHHYDLQITKDGYLPYTSVLFPSNPHDHYFMIDRLTDEMPRPAEPSVHANGPPLKITLQATPANGPESPVANLQEQLFFAIKRSDTATIRRLMQAEVDPNSADAKGIPAVAWATFAGDPETIQVLLDAGPDVRNKGSQALLIYLGEGAYRGRIEAEVVEGLIQAGADVNASESYRGTVLNQAINRVPSLLSLETINSFIKAGANVNAADGSGQTPLMLAARQNQTN